MSATAIPCLLVFALACQPCPEVIEVSVHLDGGPGTSDGGAAYCATECDTSTDCPKGMHCSLHRPGESGLCFKDFLPDGGR